MKTFWAVLDLGASGSIAVMILHVDPNPSYLLLACGWFMLFNALMRLAELNAAVFGEPDRKQP